MRDGEFLVSRTQATEHSGTAGGNSVLESLRQGTDSSSPLSWLLGVGGHLWGSLAPGHIALTPAYVFTGSQNGVLESPARQAVPTPQFSKGSILRC